MISLEDLSSNDLEYLRSKWYTETFDLKGEMARKQLQLSNKLSRLTDRELTKTALESKLGYTEVVLDELVSANAKAKLIRTQQTLVGNLRIKLKEFGSKPGSFSKVDALLMQFELDEMEQECTLLTTKIEKIDILLAAK